MAVEILIGIRNKKNLLELNSKKSGLKHHYQERQWIFLFRKSAKGKKINL